ncbi:MAG: hypothetical protein ACOH2T_26790 [Pseudomonas sp.]
MDIKRIRELINGPALDLADWIEITKISVGLWGSYKVMPEGVFFHPNGEWSEPGWRYDQLKSAAPTYDIDRETKMVTGMVLSKEQVATQVSKENRKKLLFPCTAKELIEFVSQENDICGSLFGCLPEGFLECVEAPLGPQEERTQAFLSYCAELNYPPLAIPYGGKGEIKKKCLAGKHGGFTPDTFLKSWKQASKDGFVRVENRDLYARRQK